MNKQSIIATVRDYQGFVIATIITLILIFLISSYLLPNIQKTQSTLAAQQDLDSKKALLEGKLKILEEVNYEQEVDALKKITAILPEEKDVFSIFDGLDRQEKDSEVIVSRSDFRIGVVSTESGTLNTVGASNKSYQTLDIQFGILGTREQLLRLLSNLANFKTRLFTVSDITIKMSDDTHVAASFLMTTYYQPFPPILGKVDSPIPKLTDYQSEIKEKIVQNAQLPTSIDESIPSGKNNLFQ